MAGGAVGSSEQEYNTTAEYRCCCFIPHQYPYGLAGCLALLSAACGGEKERFFLLPVLLHCLSISGLLSCSCPALRGLGYKLVLCSKPTCAEKVLWAY